MLRIAHRLAITPMRDGRDLNAISCNCLKLAAERGHVLVCDNVAEFVAEHGKMGWKEHEFPFCVPAWPMTLIEWAEPKHWRINGELVDRPNTGVSNQSIAICTNKKGSPGYSSAISLMKILGQPSIENEETEWLSVGYPAIVQRGLLHPIPAVLFWAISNRGQLQNQASSVQLHLDSEEKEELSTVFQTYSYIAMLAFGFANCKNVKIEDATAEYEPDAKWQRRFKTGDKGIKYHTIRIDGFGTPRKSGDGTDGGSHGNTRLHICRVHFSEYTAERPLFGKYVGRFWIPAHVRGNRKNGVVVTDHEVCLEATN